MQEDYGFENFQDSQYDYSEDQSSKGSYNQGQNGSYQGQNGYSEKQHNNYGFKKCNCHCKKHVREPKIFERKCCYKQRWYFIESDEECGNWYKC